MICQVCKADVTEEDVANGAVLGSTKPGTWLHLACLGKPRLDNGPRPGCERCWELASVVVGGEALCRICAGLKGSE
jgi:hypothetical protein